MFRRIRIAILLFILAIVALSTLTDKLYTTGWDAPLVVALYPINGDRSRASAEYIQELEVANFAALEAFLEEEAGEYGLQRERPIRFTLAPALNEQPPPPPRGAGVLTAMAWSLHFRWWAWWVPPKPPGPTPRVRLFLSYFDPKQNPVLEHSTALQKGLIGAVQLFADERMTGSNHAIVAHELMHTLGATDKYELGTGLPRFPEGYAEPERKPLHPQRFAELMGGRIAVSAREAKIPESLSQVLIGPTTAAEIGWHAE